MLELIIWSLIGVVVCFAFVWALAELIFRYGPRSSHSQSDRHYPSMARNGAKRDGN